MFFATTPKVGRGKFFFIGVYIRKTEWKTGGWRKEKAAK